MTVLSPAALAQLDKPRDIPYSMPKLVIWTAFLSAAALFSLIGCAFAFVDGGFSGQSLGAAGTFIVIFALTALTAWRLKVLAGRL